MPNGIVVSPDEKIIYLIEAHGDENHNRSILAFDLHQDGSVSNRRVLYNFYPGRSGDGMCIDIAGNIYVAAGLHKRRGSSETLDTRPGIHVISPEGKLAGFQGNTGGYHYQLYIRGRGLKNPVCYLRIIPVEHPHKDPW